MFCLFELLNKHGDDDDDNNIVCHKQLIDLFLEDDKRIVFVFLRMKIKVALGSVIHPISPKN